MYHHPSITGTPFVTNGRKFHAKENDASLSVSGAAAVLQICRHGTSLLISCSIHFIVCNELPVNVVKIRSPTTIRNYFDIQTAVPCETKLEMFQHH
jgi:hypothetical protein